MEGGRDGGREGGRQDEREREKGRRTLTPVIHTFFSRSESPLPSELWTNEPVEARPWPWLQRYESLEHVFKFCCLGTTDCCLGTTDNVSCVLFAW